MDNDSFSLPRLLSEGDNFPAWCERLDKKLRVEGLNGSECEDSESWKQRENDEQWKKKCRRAADFICTQLTPSILDRICSQDRLLPSTLLNRCRALCRPFNFLGLPEKVRNQIYYEILARETDFDRNIRDKRPHLSILEVSKQVRREALSIYTSNTLFYFYESEADAKKKYRQQLIIDAIHAWASKELGRGKVQNLRRLSLCFPTLGPAGKRMFRDIDFEYSPEKGLSYTISGGCQLEAKSMARLDKHVAKTRMFSQMQSLQGQILLTAVLLGSEIWERGMLKWEASGAKKVQERMGMGETEGAGEFQE